MEKRRYVRTEMGDTEVHISDRAGFCSGRLKDASRFGLCIADLPRRIHAKDGRFTAIIFKNNLKIKLNVEQRWKAVDGAATMVGSTIDNAPWDWTELVMEHEPVPDDFWVSH